MLLPSQLCAHTNYYWSWNFNFPYQKWTSLIVSDRIMMMFRVCGLSKFQLTSAAAYKRPERVIQGIVSGGPGQARAELWWAGGSVDAVLVTTALLLSQHARLPVVTVWDAGQILTWCWPLLRLRGMPICPRTKQHDVVSSINVQSIRPWEMRLLLVGLQGCWLLGCRRTLGCLESGLGAAGTGGLNINIGQPRQCWLH